MSDVKRLLEQVRELLSEAQPGPWWPELGIAPSEEEHVVYLTNQQQDTLFVRADDVAMLVNHLPDYEAAVNALERALSAWEQYGSAPGAARQLDNAVADARVAVARLRGKDPA